MYRFFVDVLQPFTVLFLATAILLALQWRKKNEDRRKLRWLTISFVLMLILCLPATGFLAIGTLEWAYPPQIVRPEKAAIVVLSGWAFRPEGVRTESILGMDSQFRCVRAWELYRDTGPCAVYVTGGKVKVDDIGPPLGELLKEELIQLGVAEEDIIVENTSRNTYENAQLSSKLLKEDGFDEIVLVTTASHLPRAVRCFEATGLKVTPSGSEYQATKFNWAVVSFLPNPDGAAAVHRAFHEWIGIILYWMQGKFSPQT